jgi:hypothetical protein
MKAMSIRIIVVFLLLAAFMPAVSATTVVINSNDWMDIYSGLEFASLKGHNARFMTSKQYATLLPHLIPKGEHVIVLESQSVPFTINLAGSLKRAGFDAETIYSGGGRAANIELAKLANASRYVIVDPIYGYNAIAAIPYAQLTNAYVLFADEKNTDKVLLFLRSQKIDSLLLYGQLDEDLTERLAVLGPEVINKGNRYKDNIEILKKYLTHNPQPQLVLTDGSIIENELMHAGKNGEATLLIGKDVVTDDVINFVKNNHFRSAVLIGNHLSQSAKRLKDATGLPVFIKFGQGITRGTIAEPVKALDTFPLPIINLELVLRKVQYNTLTKNIEITYENRGIRAFVKTSAGILANNTPVLTVGDPDVQRVESGQSIGFQYPADLTAQLDSRQALKIDMLTLYGESADTLDRAIILTTPLEVITVQDRCELSVKKVQYNERTQRFILTIENDGPVDCYSTVELREVIVNDKPTTIVSPVFTIEKRGTAAIEMKQRMTEVDLADNPEVNVHARYGEREGLMLNILDARLPVKQYRERNVILIISITIALALAVLVVWLILRPRRQKRKPAAQADRTEEKQQETSAAPESARKSKRAGGKRT